MVKFDENGQGFFDFTELDFEDVATEVKNEIREYYKIIINKNLPHSIRSSAKKRFFELHKIERYLNNLSISLPYRYGVDVEMYIKETFYNKKSEFKEV